MKYLKGPLEDVMPAHGSSLPTYMYSCIHANIHTYIFPCVAYKYLKGPLDDVVPAHGSSLQTYMYSCIHAYKYLKGPLEDVMPAHELIELSVKRVPLTSKLTNLVLELHHGATAVLVLLLLPLFV
jgi:hypothetical protein